MKPHKHAECIKAWADGAQIQFFNYGYWHDVDTNEPRWYDNTEYRIKPAAEIPEGFTPHDGVECPVDPECIVEVILQQGSAKCRALAGSFVWNNHGRDNNINDIIAYKVVKNAPVVRWQWIVKPNKGGHRGQPELTQRFYKDEKTLTRDMGSLWDVIGKAEWTRTEFDE